MLLEAREMEVHIVFDHRVPRCHRGRHVENIIDEVVIPSTALLVDFHASHRVLGKDKKIEVLHAQTDLEGPIDVSDLGTPEVN